jgi:hypothetical protein
MINIVTVLGNYRDSVNKQTYIGYQRIVITFYCRKLWVLPTIDVNILNKVTAVVVPFFLNVLNFTTDFLS